MPAIDEGPFQNIISIPSGSGGFFVCSTWFKTNFTTFNLDYWIQVSRYATETGTETHIYSKACAINGVNDPFAIPLIVCRGMTRIGDSLYLSIHDRTNYGSGFTEYNSYIKKIGVDGTDEGTYTIATGVRTGTDTDEVGYSLEHGTDYVGGSVVDRLLCCTYPGNISSGDSASLLVFTPALSLTSPSTGLGATYSSNPRILTSSALNHGITSYHEAPEGNGIRYIYHEGSGLPDWRAVQGTAGFTELSTSFSADNRPTVDKTRGWIISANVGGGTAHAWDAVTGNQITDNGSPIEFGTSSAQGRFGVRVTSDTTASMFYAYRFANIMRYDGASQVWSTNLTRGSGVPSGASEIDHYFCHSIVPTGD